MTTEATETTETVATSASAREVRSELRFGTWPHHVGVVVEAGLSGDLAQVEWRRVSQIRLYTGDKAEIATSLGGALAIYHALGDALMRANTIASEADDTAIADGGEQG